MDDDTRYASLKEDLDEIQSFQNEKAFKELQSYYGDSAENVRPEKEPPHGTLQTKSANLLTFAIELEKIDPYSLQESIPVTDMVQILIGVSTELLLNSIFMANETEFFLNQIKAHGQTPKLDTMRQKLQPLLRENSFSSAEIDRVNDVISIIQAQRNNLVHFGLQSMIFHRHQPEKYQVLAVLFTHFVDGHNELIDLLLERAKNLEENQGGIGSKPVDFEH